MIVVKDAPELRGEGGTRRQEYILLVQIILILNIDDINIWDAMTSPHYRHPFECLAFVCDSRQTARRLTFALANAFQVKTNKDKLEHLSVSEIVQA